MGKRPLEGCPCIFVQGPPSSKLRHCLGGAQRGTTGGSAEPLVMIRGQNPLKLKLLHTFIQKGPKVQDLNESMQSESKIFTFVLLTAAIIIVNKQQGRTVRRHEML